MEVSSNSFEPVKVAPDGKITIEGEINPNGVSLWTDDASGNTDLNDYDAYSTGFTGFQPEAGKSYIFYAGYPDVFEKKEDLFALPSLINFSVSLNNSIIGSLGW